jgi:prepilin-type N-terminal cleavage/methylation domain-containing protein
MSRRRAFTLRELMVTVAIIGVLFAILAPLIGHAREAARRRVCSHRFTEIGLAIHNYHAQHAQLPMAMFGTSVNEYRLRTRASGESLEEQLVL